MSDTPSSSGPALAAEDFTNCGWQDAMRSADPWDYSSIWRALLDAAKDAEGDDRQAKALLLLADACSMKFSPKRAVEPFGTRFSFAHRSSFSPNDLTESDTSSLASAVTEMGTGEPGALLLKARLADLVWLVQQPRNVDFALLAIDSYRAVPLTVETWLGDGPDCWERALRLARMCGAAIGDRRGRMEASIMAAFNSATVEDRFLGVELAELMRANGLGEDQLPTIAAQLESLGREFDCARDFWPAKRYLHEAGHWFEASGDESAAWAMAAAKAECWVKRADDRMSSDDASHAAAAEFLQNAIQIYRTIPRLRRDEYDATKRLGILEARLRDYRQRAVEELSPTKLPGIDLHDRIRYARAAVSDKPKAEAIRAFVNLQPWADPDRMRNDAIERLRRFPIQTTLFPRRILSADGRLIAWGPPAMLGDETTDSDELVIRHHMLDEYTLLVGLVTSGSILPAIETLRLEHRIREGDFVELARAAAIVPPGRSLLFGKALFAGYDGEYVAALHLLVPQIEHLARFHLSQAGVETRHRDTTGIENEKGLRFLLARPESSELLGSDIVFELSALFVEPGGPNLRNVVAHGLMDDEQAFCSAYAPYTWWLALKLLFTYSRTATPVNTEQTPPVEGK